MWEIVSNFVAFLENLIFNVFLFQHSYCSHGEIHVFRVKAELLQKGILIHESIFHRSFWKNAMWINVHKSYLISTIYPVIHKN